MGTDKSGFATEQRGWHSSLLDRGRVCWLNRLVERVNSDGLHERLPKVHIIINYFKSIPAGKFHGVSLRYIQKYINEFVIRFHGRFRESKLPERLLQATVDHGPTRTPLTCLEA